MQFVVVSAAPFLRTANVSLLLFPPAPTKLTYSALTVPPTGIGICVRDGAVQLVARLTPAPIPTKSHGVSAAGAPSDKVPEPPMRSPLAAPVAPVTPFTPSTPGAPVAPTKPRGPIGPVTPFTPSRPGAPVTPFTPSTPRAPVTPTT